MFGILAKNKVNTPDFFKDLLSQTWELILS